MRITSILDQKLVHEDTNNDVQELTDLQPIDRWFQTIYCKLRTL